MSIIVFNPQILDLIIITLSKGDLCIDSMQIIKINYVLN